MSNLRLVQEYTSPNVRLFNATDLFNEHFDTYLIQVTLESSTGSNAVEVQLVNNQGEVVGENNYDMGAHIHYSNTNTSESRVTDGDNWVNLTYESTGSFSTDIYVFNPYQDDRYTMVYSNNVGWYNAGGVELVNINAVHNARVNARATGLKFYGRASGNIDLKLRSYGIRRD
tara:strand:- start:348 stop:863 length:516 start_codon:yes stop_codon:yes gene_type:complete